MAKQEPATKQDLDALATTFSKQLSTLEKRLLESTQEMIRDAQTEILRAFLPYLESQGVRFRSLEVKTANVETGLTERMAVLERRLQEIEKRLLLRPAAA